MPARFQRSRKAGYHLPKEVVYVGRPTIWGNPYPPGLFLMAVPIPILEKAGIDMVPTDVLTVDGSVAVYAAYIKLNKRAFPLEQLRGRDLSCWCPSGEPCHADVLLAIANAPLDLTTTLLITQPDIIAATRWRGTLAYSPVYYAMRRNGYTNVNVGEAEAECDQGIYRLNAEGRKIQQAHSLGLAINKPTEIELTDIGYVQ